MTPRNRLLDALRRGSLLALVGAGCGDPVVARPLPADVELGCYDPQDNNFISCCRDITCVPPVRGACPDAEDPALAAGGSLCAPTEGPYAIAEDDPSYRKSRAGGPCCYVVDAGECCVGRPLRVAHEMRLAAIVSRGDWC
jgi:hypothetical protein